MALSYVISYYFATRNSFAVLLCKIVTLQLVTALLSQPAQLAEQIKGAQRAPHRVICY